MSAIKDEQIDEVSGKQIRMMAIATADKYAQDHISLFNLAKGIELYIETGDMPDFEDYDESETSDGQVLN